jgi:hypothetical protein
MFTCVCLHFKGIPYSDDMGNGFESSCPSDLNENEQEKRFESNPFANSERMYEASGFLEAMTTTTDLRLV